MQISNSEIKAMNVLSQKTAGRVGGVRKEEYSSCLFHLLVTSGMSERLFFNAALAGRLSVYLFNNYTKRGSFGSGGVLSGEVEDGVQGRCLAVCFHPWKYGFRTGSLTPWPKAIWYYSWPTLGHPI